VATAGTATRAVPASPPTSVGRTCLADAQRLPVSDADERAIVEAFSDRVRAVVASGDGLLTRRAALIELRDEAVALRWPAREVAATAVDDVLLELDDELVAAVEQGRLDRDTACEALSKAGSLGHRARLGDEDVLAQGLEQAEIALTMEMEDGDELWCDALRALGHYGDVPTRGTEVRQRLLTVLKRCEDAVPIAAAAQALTVLPGKDIDDALIDAFRNTWSNDDNEHKQTAGFIALSLAFRGVSAAVEILAPVATDRDRWSEEMSGRIRYATWLLGRDGAGALAAVVAARPGDRKDFGAAYGAIAVADLHVVDAANALDVLARVGGDGAGPQRARLSIGSEPVRGRRSHPSVSSTSPA
jgi:hypothetical protein